MTTESLLVQGSSHLNRAHPRKEIRQYGLQLLKNHHEHLKEQHYKQYEKMIMNISKKYSKQFNQDLDDLVSESCLIYCECLERFDDRKASFLTFLYLSLKLRLGNYCKKIIKIQETEEFVEEVHKGEKCFETSKIDFSFFKDSLSESSRQIVELVSNPPAELFSFCKREDGTKWALKINQSVVAKYLESKNWEKTKILNSFAEIKSNL
jgi:DNA-directed RNA polymerase specialized sigma24 family protein